MSDAVLSNGQFLVVSVRNRICAMNLMHVVEIMRPLPVESVAGAPLFVLGVSIIRGVPTPVVDLGLILGTPGGAPGRFVTLRLGDRNVALSVDEVLGIRNLSASAIRELPPLLQEGSKDFIEAIGTLDARVLVVLRASWEIPEETWRALTLQEAIT